MTDKIDQNQPLDLQNDKNILQDGTPAAGAGAVKTMGEAMGEDTHAHKDELIRKTGGSAALADSFSQEAGGIADDVSLSDAMIERIMTALDDGRDDDVHEWLRELSGADLADLLVKVTAEDRVFLIDRFPDIFIADVFLWLPEELASQILQTLPAARVAALISDLESDDAVNLIEDLSPRFQKQILLRLSADDRAAVEEGLTYPEDSAGRLMSREFVAIPKFWTVGKIIDYMREDTDALPDDFTTVFVIDPMYHVVGEIPLNRILRSRRAAKITDLTLEERHTIPANTDQEDVARLFAREGLTSAPVVDDGGRIIGVITIDDVVDVIHEEAGEDILRLGGVSDDMHRGIAATARSRLVWLGINLVTAMMVSVTVGLFEGTLEQIVALAVLMPIVAGMGGNAGTQAMTVTVRALATKELSRTNLARNVTKEVSVGLINGTLLAIVAGSVSYWRFDDPMLGIVIGLAMVMNLFTAALCGVLLPVTFERLKIDPALASPVFLTGTTDVVGFCTFLGLATFLML